MQLRVSVDFMFLHWLCKSFFQPTSRRGVYAKTSRFHLLYRGSTQHDIYIPWQVKVLNDNDNKHFFLNGFNGFNGFIYHTCTTLHKKNEYKKEKKVEGTGFTTRGG